MARYKSGGTPSLWKVRCDLHNSISKKKVGAK